MDKFCELEAFAAVVDQGGFTDAAKLMGVSKSSVSKHVAALESRLGARLLNRSTRRVSPTEVGNIYYDRIRRVLSDAHEADAVVLDMQSEPIGMLKVGCQADFAVHRLMPLVKSFSDQYPLVCLDIELNRGGANMIERGWDVSLRLGPLGDCELRCRKVGETTMRLVASHDYIAINGKPDTIDDLKDHQLIHSSGSSAEARWLLSSTIGQPRHVRNVGKLVVNDGTSQLMAARAGLGIAHLPDFLCSEALGNAEVVEILPTLPTRRIGVLALHSATQHTPSKIRAFIDFLANNLD
ncbi:LysR family transcriptional regulator [uncultured Shimia sp.]|uniref:LysR family transcriptional regulator n=1 Tax=uncultured Shimia sp. TaxID=573152 RepID=UPI00261C3EC1|nr:LysR family transcriptional regulator [uncultured Shimia sp.]